MNIFFKFKKLPVKHLERFLFLPRESGKLQKKFKTFNGKFQLKNSKEFPH
jgi:hypothetical protein